jgi:hypothetical protein
MVLHEWEEFEIKIFLAWLVLFQIERTNERNDDECCGIDSMWKFIKGFVVVVQVC